MFDLAKILKSEYSVSFVNVLKQNFQNNQSISFIQKPKEYHLFLLIESGKVEYLLKNGETLTVSGGNLVYIPAGCEYTSKFISEQSLAVSTIGVNFLLNSESGEYLQNNKIYAFNAQALKNVIYEIERLSYSFNQVKNKYNVQIYKAFNIISDEFFNFEHSNIDFLVIKDGVEYLHKNYTDNFDINHLAKICNISEVYFRRLFKKTFGYPPAEYRIKLRLNKACEYLKFTNLPINEIAEILGFIDSAYFTKLFKKQLLITPLQYRKN